MDYRDRQRCGFLVERDESAVTMPQPWANATFAIAIDDIRDAAHRIAPYVLRTPSISSEYVSYQLGCQVHLKAESLQHIGAFKARGATNAVMLLTDEMAAHGVVTHSSGNHAAALARAASLRRIPAHIVMPDNSAKNKIAAVRAYGVEPVFCAPNAQSRFETAERLRIETGATLVHPYDYAPVMAGQGTVGLELLEQVNNLDAVIVPVGGGGLLSGVLMAIKSQSPNIRVIAAEPEWADDASRSLQSGRIEMPTRYDSIADGLRTPLGQLPFAIIRELIDDVILVSEEAIRSAMRSLAEKVHLIVEPSGAVAFAALNTKRDSFAGKNVAVVLSGGNLDCNQCALKN
jgi:threonine dehydratase